MTTNSVGDDGPRARFVPGDAVVWAGPAEVGAPLHLEPGHPGRVEFAEPLAMIVRWVDKHGWFDHDGVFQQEWLNPVDLTEFNRLTEALRDSDWSGFPTDLQ